jgi:CheY-like chemotaxis protein
VSNALAVILGWVAEARAAEATPETIAFALDVVERRARAARALARKAIGATGPDADSEDALDVIVDEVVGALRVEAQTAGVELQRSLVTADRAISTSGRPLPLSVRLMEPQDLSRAVTNILLNALAFSPRGGRVQLTVRVEDRCVHFDVTDEGPGVAEADRDRIFSGKSARAGGAGVGLRHAKALARRLGGDLVLQPGGIGGRGAAFRLTWPRRDAKVPVPAPSIARARPLEGKRVLVVEDDSDVVDLLETALGARGATVTVARSIAELADALGGAAHHAALLDLSPLASDLPTSIASLTAHSPGIRLVAITGSATGLPEELERQQARWVRKPFEVAEVVEALTRPEPSGSTAGGAAESASGARAVGSSADALYPAIPPAPSTGFLPHTDEGGADGSERDPSKG